MNDIKCVKIKNRRNNLESNIEHSFALQFRPIFHFIKWTKNRKNKWNHFRTTFGPIFQIHIHKRTRCQQYWDLLSFAAHPPDIDCIDLDTPVNRPLDISLLWVTQPVDYRCNYECQVCFINDRVLKFCPVKRVVNLVSGFDEASHWERHSTYAFSFFAGILPFLCTSAQLIKKEYALKPF